MRVLACVQDYVEDGIEYWSTGATYKATKHRDGTYSVETNEGTMGSIGRGYLLEDVEEFFIDTKKDLTFVDAVKFAIASGIFKIQEGSMNYGCSGIICHYDDGTPYHKGDNEFYFGGQTADNFEGTSTEYFETVGIDSIAQDIAMTIEDMASDSTDCLEAQHYLYGLLNRFWEKGNMFNKAIKSVLDKAVASEK